MLVHQRGEMLNGAQGGDGGNGTNGTERRLKRINGLYPDAQR